jgi:hypothetical protein
VEHPARPDHADLDGVAVVRAAEVRRRSAHRADRPIRVAHRDRIVQLDLRAKRRRHEGEDLLAAQARQPEADAEQVRQLRLAVPAARGLRA